MKARFKGFCIACSKPIYVGQEISKRNGSDKYTHSVCPTAQPSAPKAAARSDGYREILARFDSKCVKCDGVIAEGDRILWKKGEKAFHVACDGERGNDKLDMSNGMLPGSADSYDRGPFEGPVGDGKVQVRAPKRRVRDLDRALAAEDYGDPDDHDFEF